MKVTTIILVSLFLIAPASAMLFPEHRITDADTIWYSTICHGAYKPKINGHTVVWSGPPQETWAADISNLEKPVLLHDFVNPTIWEDVADFDFKGDILTWSAFNSHSVYMYDLANPLATDNYRPIGSGLPTNYSGIGPVTNGNVIVYVSEKENYGPNYYPRAWIICAYIPHWEITVSIPSEVAFFEGEIRVCPGCGRWWLPGKECPSRNPLEFICIDGNTIVWRDYYEGTIWGFDIFERKHFVVAQKTSGLPRGISGNLVLIEGRTGFNNLTTPITCVDISDRDNPVEFPVATAIVPSPPREFSGGYYCVKPRIDGNIIVWQDHRNGNWDIYGYDIASGTEFQITDDPETQWHPDISGHIVVWEDWRHYPDPTEIYAVDISSVFGPVCRAPIQGDLNDDCKVDFNDLAIALAHWLDCNLDPPEACLE